VSSFHHPDLIATWLQMEATTLDYLQLMEIKPAAARVCNQVPGVVIFLDLDIYCSYSN